MIIPTRRTATSSKQLCLEDMILYVLKSSDSLWSTWFFDFRYQNIITEERVLRYQKAINLYHGVYRVGCFSLVYDRFRESAIV